MVNMDKILNNLIENLKKLYGERLASIILYGSCAAEGCNTSKSDVNAIVIINNLHANDLEKAQGAVKEWLKTKNPLPIFMDKAEWFNSTDVYPIEYSDIKERYKVLYGEDLVATLEIDNKNLRHQCEYELKSLLIKLRQGYMAKGDIKKIVKGGSKSLKALSRAVSRLSDSFTSPSEDFSRIDPKEAIKKLIDITDNMLKYVDKLGK
jgi:hypothetical protein